MNILSVIIPVRNEKNIIEYVISDLVNKLEENKINYEVVIIDDYSTDNTWSVLEKLSLKYKSIKFYRNKFSPGFGYAIRYGLENFSGDYVVIYMGDGSDEPEDVVEYYRKLQEGYDCVFGSRFIRGAKVVNYPFLKLFLNRLGNWLIKILFGISYNDVSNAFKGYKKEVIKNIQPLVSSYFNITVEIPLKAIIRGYRYTVIPINWYGRTSGVSKFKLKELQKKYFFSILYVLLEKILLSDEIKRNAR